MHAVDELYTQHPFYGTRKMVAHLKRLGMHVNRKRIQRIYNTMGIEALYAKPKTSQSHPEHKVYPYLLKGLSIDKPHLVYATDITYIRLLTGFIYLVAIMDWHSRYIITWALSNSLDADFCVETLQNLLQQGYRCQIFNSDQGSQFTSLAFTHVLLQHGIQISMDGRGRCYDNIMVERLWRSIKYECVYLRELQTIQQAREAIDEYILFYNQERPHQSLNYKTPKELFIMN